MKSVQTIAASLVMLSASTVYANDYNSGYYITDVDVYKYGERATMVPEQPQMPELLADHVLVGIGARAGKTTVTTITLWYRQILGNGEFGPLESTNYGSKPSHELECQYVNTQDKIAITGMEWRINGSDDIAALRVSYRKFDSQGNLGTRIYYGTGVKSNDQSKTCYDPGSGGIEVSYFPPASGNTSVVTGVGLVNHNENMDSMWLYRGTYINR
ncbi:MULTISPECIES: hypothetical protein [Pseudoalteromonas]|uniref:Uncharacterized protein n=1 Tax=Pseudoalteromonas rubra TaxID=43658 RepID=A0A0L0EVC6_9GAMM|nr:MULTISPECIES: hypothetical protein [Pseudoalteromonas]ALU42923.1 hypothetical protein AT705_08175 [Pseudoalteromonas rubra]KNC68391.1 hypothetical protein AC626_04900 [Pseudoalteromonas rubra]MDK1313389.1 hypothetical protein [Pseudoalteromonas sp. R96]